MLKNVCLPFFCCSVLSLAATAEPPMLYWAFPEALKQWRSVNFDAATGEHSHFVGRPHQNGSALILDNCDIDASRYDTLFVAVRGSVTGVGSLKVAGREVCQRLFPRSAEYRLIRFDLENAPAWQGRIKMLQLDFTHSIFSDLKPSDRYEVAFIALASRDGNRLDNGDGALQLDGQTVGWRFTDDAGALPEAKGFRVAGSKASATADFASLDQQGTFAFSFWSEGGAGRAIIAFTDLDGKPMGQQEIGIPASKKRHMIETRVVAPELAAAATVTIRADGEEEMRFGDLTALRLTAESTFVEPHLAYPQRWWFSKWILPRGADVHHGWLRRTFVLPKGATVTEAEIQFSADGVAEVLLNGNRVAVSSGDWKKPSILKIPVEFLKAGANLIEVELTGNGSSRPGFIAEARFRVGKRIEVLRTDAQWYGANDRKGPWRRCRIEGEMPRMALRFKPMSLVQRVRITIDRLPESAERGSKFTMPITVYDFDSDCAAGIAAQIWQDGKLVHSNWYQPRLKNGKMLLEVTIPYSVKPGKAFVRCQTVDALCTPAPILPIEILPNSAEKQGFPSAKVVRRNGISIITVNGKEIPITQALFGSLQDNQLHYAAEAGIHLWGVWVHDFGFTANGDDFSKVDETIEYYLRNDPEAYLIVNTIVDARYHPWWLQEHPEARCRLENGSDNIQGLPEKQLKARRWGKVGYMPSYSSPVWRQEFGDAMRRLVRHLAKQPYAHRIIGIQVSNGHTSEWFNWGSPINRFTDYSECGKAHFRRWLAERYGSDAALRKAWKNPSVTLATAEIPGEKRRVLSGAGVFFDPATHQDVIDYNDFLQFLCCDTIRHYLRIVKEESGGRLLTGAYYGYVFHLSEGGLFGQASGHFDSRQYLDAPEVDFTVSPIAYGALRQLGNTAAAMILPHSWNLAGKVAWNQDDLRTQWSDQVVQGNIETVFDAKLQMERELARNLAEGNAMQWYDFSLGWTMGDRRLMGVAKRLAELTDRYRTEFADFAPEKYALLVVDENAVSVWNPRNPPYDGALVNVQRREFIRAGIPWKAVLFSDLMKHPELLRHRMIYFMNSLRLDDVRLRFLKEKVLCDGRFVIFSGPVGIVSDEGFGGTAAKKLFGTDFVVEREAADLQAECTGLFEDLRGMRYGTYNHRRFSEFLRPSGDTAATCFAVFQDTGNPAALYWDKGNCRILWTAVPTMGSDILRVLARRHDIPVLTDSDDPVYVGNGCIGIHAASDGVKRIFMLTDGSVREIFTGRLYTPVSGHVEIAMKRGETRIFVPDNGDPKK